MLTERSGRTWNTRQTKAIKKKKFLPQKLWAGPFNSFVFVQKITDKEKLKEKSRWKKHSEKMIVFYKVFHGYKLIFNVRK